MKVSPLSLSRVDLWLIGVAGIFFLASLGLLYDTKYFFPLLFQEGTSAASAKKVAVLSRFEQDVRRKKSNELTWFPVEDPTDLFVEDSVYAGNASQAELVLADQTHLWLSPNSLIQLTEEIGQLRLEIKMGKVEGFFLKKSSILIQTPTRLEKVEGENTHFQIERKNKDALQIAIRSGQVEILPIITPQSPPAEKTAAPVMITENHAIEMREQGNSKPVVIIFPAREALAKPTSPIDPFAPVFHSTVTPAETAPTPAPQFKFFKTPLPAPVVPDHSEDYELKDSRVAPAHWWEWFAQLLIPSAMAEENGPTLQWTAISGAFSYQLEISLHKTFQPLIFQSKTNSNSFTWANAKAGNYYWRVAGIDADGDAGEFSHAVSLLVFNQAKPAQKIATEKAATEENPPKKNTPAPKTNVKNELTESVREENYFPPPTWRFFLGLNSLAYQESLTPHYSFTSIRGEAEYEAPLIEHTAWEWFAHAHSTLLPLANNAGTNLRILGAEAAVAYRFSLTHSVWEEKAALGGTYQTTFISDNLVGFHNMSGPVFSFWLKRNFLKDNVEAYAKLALSAQTGILPAFDNREITAGAVWTHFLESGFPLLIAIEDSQISLNFSNVLTVNCNSITASVGTFWY
jgi:hypothetical protein